MEEPRWTLDELAGRVGAALAVDYPGQPSGRVRDLPDRRAIRWYTTIGLVDRPVAHRGRTALYGPRHLLQLVAVKRLQARGLPLVAIQQELAGATDAQLARVARLPGAPGPSAATAAAADGGTPSSRVPARPAAPVAARRAAASPARRAAFWREPPSAGSVAPAGPGAAGAIADPAGPDPAGRAGPAAAGVVTSLRGVRLGGGATLLLEPGRELDAADVQAILDAAGPLVATLRARGLDGAGARREHP
jgi:DNA-binding transcriptional MerR regulator